MKNIKSFKQFESVYSDISKRIGWDKRSVSIPSRNEILELTERAENGDQSAFTKLFMINRFAETPNTDEEIERLNLAIEGFRKTSNIFYDMDSDYDFDD